MSKKNINRKSLSKKINQNIGYSKLISENILNDIFSILSNSIKKNDKIKLTSFGTFYKRKKKERIGLNPKSREKKIISARTVVTFKPSKIFKKKINL